MEGILEPSAQLPFLLAETIGTDNNIVLKRMFHIIKKLERQADLGMEKENLNGNCGIQNLELRNLEFFKGLSYDHFCRCEISQSRLCCIRTHATMS